MKICLSCEGVAATEQDRCDHCGVTLVPTSAAHFPIRRGETDAANPLLGAVIDGKFLIQGVLGRGGMGTVFRACHTVSLVPVALKLLHPRLSVRTEYRRGLLAEARKAGRVVHDHCARVIDVGETEAGTVYLAMELADGEPLDAWVRERGLPPGVAADVLLQICRALVAIHAAGLVHRDLSSRNVMVAVREGRPTVKVLDFGIAQSLRLAPATTDDPGERAFANPGFAAPEQLAGQNVDARADLYSFGVLAYLLLCGRLPVDEHDARAAVRATVAGRLLPMPPVPGVPRRLARLVQRCLHLDRERRPASAAALLAELTAVVDGRLRWLPRFSTYAFAAAVVLAIATFVRATPPFLRLVGGAVPLSEGPLLPDGEVHYLGSSALRRMVARFGGFPPGRLEIEVTQQNSLQLRKRLQPTIQSEGLLVLGDAQPAWHEAIEGIVRACADGPVDLAFVVPGIAVLGSARICIDDTPAELAMQVVDAAGDAVDRLDGTSIVRLDCHDHHGIAELRLVLRLESGAVHPFVLPPDRPEFALGAAMAGIHGVTGPLGPATLDLTAIDRAHNRSALSPLVFADCDFAAPRVVEVTGPAAELPLPFLDGRARLRVRLDAAETGLQFHVRGPDKVDVRIGAVTQAAGTSYEFDLLARAAGEPFPAGYYEFAVTDPAGNRTDAQLALAFRSRSADASFVAVAGAQAQLVADEIVVGPVPTALWFHCNATFAPVGARVRSIGTTPVLSESPVQLSRDGRWRIDLAALPRGSYELELDLEEVGGARVAATKIVRPLTVLPSQLVVHLPEVSQRYLPALVRANLLVADDTMLQQGGSVTVEADLGRYLRGRLWGGAEPSLLVPLQPLRDGADGDPRLLPASHLLRGRNILALELRDVFGRPVAVTVGDRPAPILRRDDLELCLFADFFDDPTPPQLVGDELRVEHGQSVSLRLRCNVPFQAADLSDLQLAVRSAEVDASSVRPLGAGCEIAFLLKFPVWSAAADLADLPRASYAQGQLAQLDATLRTPAGDYPLHLTVRTARTTLRVLSLAEVGDGSLAAALAGTVMVPVLAPESGEFPDPVPSDAAGRDLFRPQPAEAVRGIADFFVQDREFTIAQYAALLAALPGLGTVPPGLWHADDPLLARRLAADAMLPSGWNGDRNAFVAAAAASPEAAVAGVDFFQAFAAVRLLGLLVAGDAAVFRLPLGCELELAAFGTSAKGAARNGASAQGGRVRADGWRDLAGPDAPMGATAAGNARLGDLVRTPLGPIHGLDFGVREWVLDLPQGADSGGESLLREWIGDRDRHVQRALELAGSRLAPADLRGRLPADLQARLRTFGVVRGLPYGQLGGLLDADGRPLSLVGLDVLPASVPGVVRTEQLRRDGRDLMPGHIDPRLHRTGFRVAGGDVFVARVRGR